METTDGSPMDAEDGYEYVMIHRFSHDDGTRTWWQEDRHWGGGQEHLDWLLAETERLNGFEGTIIEWAVAKRPIVDNPYEIITEVRP